MPISKQKLKEIAISLPGGVLSNGVSDSAAELLNKIVSRVLGLVFPKGSSAEAGIVGQRLAMMQDSQNPIVQSARRSQPCVGVPSIPSRTIKSLIRAQAGDIKVPDNTISIVCGMVHELLSIIMLNAAAEIKDGVAMLEAKHIKASMQNGMNPNHLVANSISNVRARRSSSSRKRRSGKKSRSGKKRSGKKSRSGKRRSSSKRRSNKRCGGGKSPVHSFKRSGRMIKSYCRKSSSRR